MQHWGDFGGIFYQGVQVGKFRNWNLTEDLAGAPPMLAAQYPGAKVVKIVGWKAAACRYRIDGKKLAEQGVKNIGETELEFRFLHRFARSSKECRGRIVGEVDTNDIAQDTEIRMEGRGGVVTRFI